jgi:CheY-like chemotaxis protein
MKHSFGKDSYQTVTASVDGKSLMLVRNLHPYLITLDVLMSGMDGPY